MVNLSVDEGSATLFAGEVLDAHFARLAGVVCHCCFVVLVVGGYVVGSCVCCEREWLRKEKRKIFESDDDKARADASFVVVGHKVSKGGGVMMLAIVS